MQIQSYRDLEAWRLAMDYVVVIYSVTARFPPDEQFGLTAQLRRAAVAIPSNISEGHQHGTRAYLRYVVIALGSAAECATQLEIACRLNYATETELSVSTTMGDSLRRLLFGLRRSLRRKLRRDANVKR